MPITIEELGLEAPRSPGTTAEFSVEFKGGVTFDDLGLEEPKSMLQRVTGAIERFMGKGPTREPERLRERTLRETAQGPLTRLEKRTGEALRGGAGIVEAAAQLGLVIPAGLLVEATAGLTGLVAGSRSTELSRLSEEEPTTGLERAERAIQGVREAAQPTLEFLQPRTPIGKDITRAIEKPFEALSRASELAGEFVREKTGSDIAGAVTTGAVGVSPLLLPFGKKGVRAGKRIVAKGRESFEAFKEQFKRPAEEVRDQPRFVEELEREKVKPTPRFEKTKAGMQGIFPETPGREIPKTGIKVKERPTLTALEEAAAEAERPQEKLFGGPTEPVGRVKIVKPPKPKVATVDQSLSSFIENEGGISLQKSGALVGEFRGLRESGPKGKRVIKAKSGRSPDELAQAAEEAGFIKDADVNTLKEALDRDLRGETVFSTKGDRRQRKIDLEAERELAKGQEDAAERGLKREAEIPFDVREAGPEIERTEAGAQGFPAQGTDPTSPNFQGKPFLEKVGLSTKTERIVKRSEMINELQEVLEVPIRIGRQNLLKQGKAIGVFIPKEEVIRLKFANDLDVTAHEVGHFLDKRVLEKRFSGKNRSRQFDKELVAMGKELYGSRVPPGGFASEGVAEFVHFYITDPAKAKLKAPGFFEHFESVIKGVPDVKNILLKTRADYKLFKEQPAVSRVLAQISESPKQKRAFNLDEVYTATLDDLHPLKIFVDRLKNNEVLVNALDDPYILGRVSRGWIGKVRMFLEEGAIDFRTLNKVGPSLNEILAPVESNIRMFKAYITARRARELHSRGKASGLSNADIKATIEQLGSPEFAEAFQGMQEWNTRLLEFAKDAGVLSKEGLKTMLEANKEYVPFYRVIEESETRASGRGRTFANLFSPIKRIKGSSRDIIDPLESTIKNAYALLNVAERNVVGQALVRLSQQHEGLGKFVEKVPIESIGIGIKDIELENIVRRFSRIKETKTFQALRKEFTSELGETGVEGSKQLAARESVVKEALVRRGFSEGESQVFIEKLKAAKTSGATNKIIEKIVEEQTVITLTKEFEFLPPEIVKIFRPDPKIPGMDHILGIMFDGKKQLYQLSPDLYRAMLSLDREASNILIKLLGAPARLLRAGATTFSPEFLIRNPIKDQWTAAILSKYGYVPFADAVKGIFSIVNKDKIYQDFLSSGGLRSSIVSLDRPEMQRALKILTQLGKSRSRKLGEQVILHPIDTMRILSEFGEEMTRVGEFAKGRRAELKAGKGQKEAKTLAAFASREVTVDFGRMGTKTSAVNQLVAFFNARIQGGDRLVRAMKDNPGKVLAFGFTGVTLPTILLYLNNRQDPRYTELARWQKDVFWIFPTGSMTHKEWAKMSAEQKEEFNRENPIYRMPKSFDLGLFFGTIPERALQYLDTRDPKALDDMWESIKDGLAFNVTPTFALPFIENMANYSQFRERPIVSRSKEKLEPREQFGPFTSEAAKLIGEVFNVSPAKVDNVIRGFSGGAGRLATDVLDPVLRREGPSLPARTLADIPIIRALVARFPAQLESIETFYKALNKSQTANATFKELRKQRREAEAKQYREDHQTELKQFGRLSFTARILSDLRRQVSKIRQSNLNPEEKRKRIDVITFRMGDFAKKAVQK